MSSKDYFYKSLDNNNNKKIMECLDNLDLENYKYYLQNIRKDFYYIIFDKLFYLYSIDKYKYNDFIIYTINCLDLKFKHYIVDTKRKNIILIFNHYRKIIFDEDKEFMKTFYSLNL